MQVLAGGRRGSPGHPRASIRVVLPAKEAFSVGYAGTLPRVRRYALWQRSRAFARQRPAVHLDGARRNFGWEGCSEMVLYVPLPIGGKHPKRRGPRRRWPVRNGGMEDSGQQDAEPALAGELEAIAESDRPRGASQGGDHGDISRALRYLLATPGPFRLPALASVLVRDCFRAARLFARPG